MKVTEQPGQVRADCWSKEMLLVVLIVAVGGGVDRGERTTTTTTRSAHHEMIETESSLQHRAALFVHARTRVLVTRRLRL